MSIRKELYPPQEWQDFEHLCLKIWGELWEIPNEIDFNSNNPQGQNGVDIVGIPKGTKSYFGIQCKNRALHYSTKNKSSVLTKNDLKSEIQKAKGFEPGLQKLIIATSLRKDKKLEEFIRVENKSSQENGSFEIQICFWEFISLKIQESISISKWYNGVDSLPSHSVKVSFGSGESVLNHSPKFIRVKKNYRLPTEREKELEREYYESFQKNINEALQPKSLLGRFFRLLLSRLIFSKSNKKPQQKVEIILKGKPIDKRAPRQPAYLRQNTTIVDKRDFGKTEYCDYQILEFRVCIENNGPRVIEDFKLRLKKTSGDVDELKVKSARISEVLNKTARKDTFFGGDQGLIQPEVNHLVQKDNYISDIFELTPKKESPEEITFSWELISRDFSDNGELKILVEPRYTEHEQLFFIQREVDAKVENEIDYKKYMALAMPNF